MRYSSISGAKICYPSASGSAPAHPKKNPLRTLVRKRSRPSGRPRGTSPQKDSCDHSGSSVQKNRRTSGLHHPTFSGTIILHPWITETCAQQIGIFMHSPTLPSRSMEVAPFITIYFDAFPMEKKNNSNC